MAPNAKPLVTAVTLKLDSAKRLTDGAISQARNWDGGEGGAAALEDLGAAMYRIEEARLMLVAALRADGYSWAQIGLATGVTRQAACQNWAQLRTDGVSVWKEPKL